MHKFKPLGNEVAILLLGLESTALFLPDQKRALNQGVVQSVGTKVRGELTSGDRVIIEQFFNHDVLPGSMVILPEDKIMAKLED